MFEEPNRVVCSDTLETPQFYQVQLPSRLTAYLPISLQRRPRHQQPTRATGSPSSSRCSLTACYWSEACCAVADLLYRGPIRRHQQKAEEAGCLRPLQRAVRSACTTGPRFSWQDAATTRTGPEEFLLRRVTVAASINPLEPCSRWVSANSPSTPTFPLTLAPSQCSLELILTPFLLTFTPPDDNYRPSETVSTTCFFKSSFPSSQAHGWREQVARIVRFDARHEL